MPHGQLRQVGARKRRVEGRESCALLDDLADLHIDAADHRRLQRLHDDGRGGGDQLAATDGNAVDFGERRPGGRREDQADEHVERRARLPRHRLFFDRFGVGQEAAAVGRAQGIVCHLQMLRLLRPQTLIDRTAPHELRVRADVGDAPLIEDDDAIALHQGGQPVRDNEEAHIAFGGQQVSEGRIAATLWPEADGDSAEQSLATTLFRLRKLLRHDVIRRQEGKLTLDADVCWVDCQELDRVLSMNDSDMLDEDAMNRRSRSTARRF
ncbi:MAG: hypothetical protein JNK68_10865 [Betaproteobacteria bacterium]|nr:hypothetical protein [Betaproteobacteria bacterium]